MEVDKKLNPDYNSIYDKLYQHKKQEKNEEYATFNPNKTKTIDINSMKMTLHQELNSLSIDPEI